MLRLCAAALPFLLLAASAHPWQQFGASPLHASRGVAAGPSSAPFVKWFVPPPSDAGSSLTIFASVTISASNTLFVTAYDGCIASFDAASGASRWEKCLPEKSSILFGTPALSADGESVYIAAFMDQSISALSTVDGSLVWRFNASSCERGYGCFRSSPVISPLDGMIFAGAADSYVYALNPTTGSLVWKYATDGEISSTPALGPRGATGGLTAYVASMTGALSALDAAVGTLLWTTSAWSAGGELNFGLQSSPSLSDDGTRVFIGTWDGALLCFDASSGVVLWRFNASTALSIPAPKILTTPSLSSDGQLVYGGTAYDGGPMSAEFGTLFAVNTATGTLAWATLVSCDIVTAPVVGASGTLFVGVYVGDGLGSGGVAAYDGARGTMLWSKPLSEGVYASPSMGADGTLYVGGSGGELFALSQPSPGPTALPSATPSPASPLPAALSMGAVVALAVFGGIVLAVAALVAVRAIAHCSRVADTGSASAGGFAEAYRALSG